MKKKLILMFLGLFLLCGCEMKGDYEFTINEDKTMDFKVMMGLDDELIDAMLSMSENNGEDIFGTTEAEDEIIDLPKIEDDENADIGDETTEYTDEDRREYFNSGEYTISGYTIEEIKQKGLKVEEFQDEKYTGYKLTGKIDNIDNLIGTPDFNLDEIAQINDKKIFVKEGSVYKGKIEVGDPTDMEGETDSTTSTGINLIYNFTLNLPNKAKSSNATTVSEDGKTLTWNLSSGNISTIEFEFEFPSIFTFLKDNMLLTAGIAVVVVLIIVLIVTLILKKSNRKNNEILNDLTTNTTPMNKIPMEQEQNIAPTLDLDQTITPQEPVDSLLNNQPTTEVMSNIVTQQEINPMQQYNEQIIEPEINKIEINEQQNIQQPTQNSSQEEIINAINSIPVVQEIQTQNVEIETQQPTLEMSQNIVVPQPELTNQVQPELQFVTNVEQQNNIIQSEPTVQQPVEVPVTDTQPPTITPVVPTPLPQENINTNVKSPLENLVQPEMQFFTGEQSQNNQTVQPEMKFVINEQVENNVVQPNNNNINNQGI